MINIKKLYSVIVLCFILLSLAFIQGCDENNPINPQVLTARLMVLHASPDAPNLDIYINNNLVSSNFPYLNTTNYKDVSGDAICRVTIYPTGGSVALIDTSVYCQNNKYYTLIAFDSLQNIQPLFLTDDLTVPGSTNSSLRFIHLVPNGVTYDGGASGKSPWFPFYNFGVASNFRAVTAGTYSLQVYLAGSPTVVANSNSQVLAQGKIYTMIARGFAGATGTQALGVSLFQHN
ncbi:MAG: DUF4397 domain-containing protein [Ignavibacteria bacterium]